jgi:hypothetical protein
MHRFGLASECLELDFEESSYRLKTIYQLKKECSTFEAFELSDY